LWTLSQGFYRIVEPVMDFPVLRMAKTELPCHLIKLVCKRHHSGIIGGELALANGFNGMEVLSRC